MVCAGCGSATPGEPRIASCAATRGQSSTGAVIGIVATVAVVGVVRLIMGLTALSRAVCASADFHTTADIDLGAASQGNAKQWGETPPIFNSHFNPIPQFYQKTIATDILCRQ
jgi:hypothetical protein